MKGKNSKARNAVLLLAALFLMPWLLAYGLYYWQPSWLRASTVHHGQLLEPVVINTQLQHLQGKWALIYWHPSECLEACLEKARHIAKMHVALGEEQARVVLFFLTDSTQLQKLSPQLKDAGWVAGSADTRNMAELMGGVPPKDQGWLFLQDPKGWILIRYGQDAPLKGVLKDVKRLLKISYVG